MLFDVINLRGLTLKNRLLMSPMCMYMSHENAQVTDWHVVHYATRAQGGAALVMVEAIAVSPEGRISSQDLGIYDEAHLPGLTRLVEAIHAMGAKAGIQLAHAGRKSKANVQEIFAPSAVSYDEMSPMPAKADEAYIMKTIDDFRTAAQRADRAGFDLAQVHAAHGYYLNQFLSPLTNLRNDGFGGNFENRIKVLAETITAVREVWPADKPLGMRVSAEEYEDGGLHPADVAAVINAVKDRGIDYVDVSSGGLTPIVPKTFNGYQIPMAREIREVTGLPVAAGGLVTDPLYAEEIVASGSADMVYLGRELLRNPYFPLCAAVRLGADVAWPKPYERAKPQQPE